MEKLYAVGHDILLKGDESWPIEGDLLSKEDVKDMINLFTQANLKRYWNCLEKAKYIADMFGRKEITLGRLKVLSKDYRSGYGFEFNPPYEFHAWFNYKNGIIDLALPGVIELGCLLKDEYGYLLDRRWQDKRGKEDD